MALNRAERIDCDPESYHDMPGISQSMLKLYIKDPGLYRQRYVLGVTESGPTPKHFQWGRDFEDLLFYDRLPAQLIPTEVLHRSERDGKEVLSRRGAAWTEWATRMATEHPGARLLKQDEWDSEIQPLLLARDQVRAHGRATKLLDGERHVALEWTDERTDLHCKCQLDVVSRWQALVDLKTSRDADAESFRRDIWNFGYHLQAYWYRRAWLRHTGQDWPFVFVVVQTSPSYRCETYDLSPAWYELAERQIGQALLELHGAYQRNYWQSSTCGSIVTLDPPPWARA